MGTEYLLNESESNRQGLHDLRSLESREDVATLLDVYQEVMSEGISSNQILKVKEDNSKNYYFVIGTSRVFGFDIVSYIDSRYTAKKVTNANIKLLFPTKLSRLKREYVDSRGRASKGLLKLLYQKKNLLITIPRDGEVIIGRSPKRADFVIDDNENVSRVHCSVYFDKDYGVTRLSDCNSQNGTFLDGKRVNKEGITLAVGETISIAGEKFLVVD